MFRFLYCRLIPAFFVLGLLSFRSAAQTNICVGCTQNTDPATVIFSINLEEFYLVIDQDYSETYILGDGDSLKFNEGRYDIRVVHPQINDILFSLNVDSGEIQKRRIKVSNLLLNPPKSSYSSVLSYSSIIDDSLPVDDNSEKSSLSFSIDNSGFYTVIDQDYDGATPLSDGGSIELNRGEYEIRLVHPNFNDITFSLHLNGNEQLKRRIILPKLVENPPRSSYHLIKNYANIEIRTETGGEIYINGDYEGTGDAVTFLKPDNYDLKIIHPEFGELETKFSTDMYTKREIQRFNRNPNRPFTFRNLIPGYSYLNTERNGLAYTTWAAIGIIGGFALLQNSRYNAKLQEYRSIRNQYDQSRDRRQAESLASDARNKLIQLDNVNNLLTYSIAGLALTYTLSTIHGILKPSSGFSTGTSESGLSFSQGNSPASFTLRYSF